jgi:hypothetical protein
MFQILLLANGCFIGSRVVGTAAVVTAVTAGVAAVFASVIAANTSACARRANTGASIATLAFGVSRVSFFTKKFLRIKWISATFDENQL